MLDLGIVIVNWNTSAYLRRCLETVTASSGDFSYRVIVVDNASSDDSVAMVRREFPTVHVIESPVNGGYSYANNIGLRELGYHEDSVQMTAPRYALLLNPDTEVPPTALADMVALMDARPEVGIAGPKLVLEDGSLDLACRRSFPSPLVSVYHFTKLSKLFRNSPTFARYNLTYLDPDVETEVDTVVGAFMLLRREAIAMTGLLDEAFFMYGEDIDWAYRIKAAGWTVIYHPQVVVKHVKRAASRRSPKAQFEFLRAMLIFYRKHYRATTPLWLHGLVMMGLLAKGGLPLWRAMQTTTPSPRELDLST